MNFASDNVFGVDPRIFEAMVAVNAGTMPSYGYDDLTRQAEQALNDVFGREVESFLVLSGTAANGLGLSAVTPPYGAIFCHADAHIAVDECNSPELFTGGAKIVGLREAGGKITPGAVECALAGFIRGEHDPKPATVSLTQASELGTVYSAEEVAAFGALCRAKGMRLHMDGARFANAVAGLGCTPADITWKAGVDVLSFGATKNGAMALEAVVFFDKALAHDFKYRRMRGGQLLSKGRFFAAQMIAYLRDGLWLDNARHANRMAAMLAEGLVRLPGVRLPVPVEANEAFPIMPKPLIEKLKTAGGVFYEWQAVLPPADAASAGEAMVRFVCSWATREEDVKAFLAAAR
jgi:threonine aldolase